jgi:hypothetical protein
MTADRRFERAAVGLAALGYYVFPCKPHGKEPLTKNGWQDATRDESKILHWWDRWPDANIAVACGPSGIVALDIDSKHGADPREVLPALGFDNYPIVMTGEAPEPDAAHPESLAEVRGAHALFRSDLSTTKTTVKGVELRGVGGYIVAPPSVHPSGLTYEGTLPPVSDLPGAPASLAGILVANGGSATVPVPGDDEHIEPGGRHEALLAWTRSRLTARGILGRPALDAMLGHNARVMRPALPESEVERLWSHLEKTRIAESERAVEQALAAHRETATFEKFSALRARRPLWLMRPYLPLGKVTILAGAPGHGKSQLMAQFAAMTSRGLMHGDIRTPGGVLMISAEDDAGDTIKPRLMAADADLDRVERMFVRRRWGDLVAEGLITLPGDVTDLHLRLSRRDIRLVVLDPVASFFDGAHSTLSNQDVRGVLDPLKTLAETYAVAIVLILHLNKQSDVREWAARIAESHGFQAAARSVMVLGPDPDDPEGVEGVHKVFGLSKSNLARKAGTSMRLEIVEMTVHEDGEAIETTRVEMRGLCEISPDDLLMPSTERTSRVEVGEWLVQLLGDRWMKSADVEKAAISDGWSKKMIERVRKSQGFQKVKQKGVKHGPWWVAAPSTSPDLLPGASGNLGDVGDVEGWNLGDVEGQDPQDPQHRPNGGTRARGDLDEYRRWRDRMLGERDDEDEA